MKTFTKRFFLFATTIFLGAATVNAQCSAGFTWSQTTNNVIDFVSTSVPNVPNSSFVYWTFGDNTTTWMTQNPSHTYSNPGNYIVCITVIDSLSSCSDTYCDSITVYGNVLCMTSVNATVVQAASCSTCADGTGYATMTGGTAPYTYSWSSGGTSAYESGLAPGFYTVCITDANGCMSCDSVAMNYTSSNCNASFTWTQTVANEIDFVSTSTGVTAQTIYGWDYGDNTYNYSMTGNSNHIYASAGSYIICLTIYDSLNLCTSTFCDSVTVWGNSAPSTCDANFFIYPDSLNSQQAWGYNLSTGGPGMTYQWSWGDNTPIDVAQYPSHIYANTGTYTVCLVVVDSANQCTDTMCQSLTALRLSQQAAAAPYYVNIIPQGPQSVNEIAAGTFSLYPNPAQGELKLKADFSLIGNNYRVLDVTGRIIASGKLTGTSIDVSTFDNGMYMLQLENNKGMLSSQRFMKD
ncbi:MAG: PKD domain-containing protein [Bacteroidota bacterium]|nr:PKD domain-containing protein [Bacteroidota bacterium]